MSTTTKREANGATTKRRSLLDIQDDFLALDDLIDEVGGEITDPRVEHALDSLIHEMGVERDRKLDGYCAFIRELELRSAARKEEVERLQLRIKRDANVIGWLKTRMIEFLRSINTKKVETDRFVLSRCANGGKAPLRYPSDYRDLPADYVVQVISYRIDTDKIRKDLEEGKKVKGCFIEDRGEHLRIS